MAKSTEIANRLNVTDKFFVRPNSPLKPFSGRVAEPRSLTLAKLDHGFYCDDETLPVVVAPFRNIGKEWRFVIANQRVVAGAAYAPKTRKPVSVELDSDAAAFASMVALQIPSPAAVYVLDVCECSGELRLLELNPFGGADLYACDAIAIIDGVSAIAAAS